jgi:hypothetical protein
VNVQPKLDLRAIAASMSAGRLLGLVSRASDAEPPAAAVPRSTWSTQATVQSAVRRSIHASGLWRTARAGAHEEALRTARPALERFLAVRTRSHERARRALAELEEHLEAGEARTLAAPPGPTARLLRLARTISDPKGSVAVAIEHAPWDAAPPGRAPAYASVLDGVRRGVSELELELMLLSLGLGLSDDEVAHVVGVGAVDVRARIDAARAWIALQLEEEPAARGERVEDVLGHALAVLPPPAHAAGADAIPHALPAGTVIAGRYELEATVGGGAFGHVYRARDRRVHTHVVALKLAHRPALTEAAKEGALAELSRIASAFHPSLVQLKEYGWHEDRLWFAMPFYDGETLEARLERAPLSPAEAARLLAPVADALGALHAAGIRHQDVKPENIFLARLGEGEPLPVLLDLGVAARSDDIAVAGTPMYFAPEVARRVVSPDAEVAITDRADVFALAMTFVHCVAPPVHDEPELATFLAERADAPPALPTHAALAPLRASLVRWLSPSAADRPTASALARELEALGAHARPVGWTRGRVAALGLALTVLAAAGGYLAARSSADGAPVASAQAVAETPSFVRAAELAALRERVEAAEARAAFLEARLSADE